MTNRSDLATWLGEPAKVDPQVDTAITQVASIEHAARETAVFAVEPATLIAALASPAGMILANTKLKREDPAMADERIVWVRDARYSFSLLARRLAGSVEDEGVHPTAVVGKDVILGTGSSIGPYAVLGDGVRVGRDCRIDARVTIYPGVVLGDEVTVQAGAVLGSAGFGYARNSETGEYVLFPQQGRLLIENRVEIGANTTIDRGALGETRIGSGTKIDNLVHIGHNCVIGKNVVIAAQTGISGSSVVEDGAVLGGQVGIGEHATVGEGVILGGGAGVLSGKKMHGKGEVFWGRPARPLKEYLRDLASLKRGRDRT
jgi:UDP-3-O-[3-hydroxymyristoyl] glucosamine N-acyltransferase